MTKPREFWIGVTVTGFAPLVFHTEPSKERIEFLKLSEVTHVIEYSAYEALGDSLKLALSRFTTIQLRYTELQAQCEKLVSALDRMVRGFDQDIATTPRSFAADDCRKTLEEYRKWKDSK